MTFPIDTGLLAAGVLLLAALLTSPLVARFGMPLLLLFVGVGMLAGSDGLGGIAFDDALIAQSVSTVALVVILFQGGLSTPLGQVRRVLLPSGLLASVGVLGTAGLTAGAAWLLLDFPPLTAVLVGSILASTDAPAVFSLLRNQGIHLREDLQALIEVESGANDPAAVLLTVACLQAIVGPTPTVPDLIGFFVLQLGLGAVLGWLLGELAAWALRRLRFGAAALYPLFVLVAGVFIYGLTVRLGGSGFLAVYVAGIVIGHRHLPFRRSVLAFADGLAWLAQIGMFVMLGLLSFPGRLIEAAPTSLAIAGALIFVSRPLVVTALLLPFGRSWREILFVAWVGLKGAVPIVLATYPLLAGIHDGSRVFDAVFFVVIASVLLQGWTAPWLARRLGLSQPAVDAPPVALEIASLHDVDGEIVEYSVQDGSRVAGRRIADLGLPDGAVIAMISRREHLVPPRGKTAILPGDHVFVVSLRSLRPALDRLFGGAGADDVAAVEFPLPGDLTVGRLRELYGVPIQADDALTVDALLRRALGDRLGDPDAVCRFGGIALRPRVLGLDGRVEEFCVVLGEAAEPRDA